MEDLKFNETEQILLTRMLYAIQPSYDMDEYNDILDSLGQSRKVKAENINLLYRITIGYLLHYKCIEEKITKGYEQQYRRKDEISE